MAKKTNKTFRITGRVIDRTVRQGVSNLRVEGWDKDLICNDMVGSATTDEQGTFVIEFTSAYFKELFLDRQPDLFFKVFRANELIKSTEDSVLWNVAVGVSEVVIELDISAVGMPEETSLVRGTVTDANQKPLANLIVRAFERDLRHPQLLGTTTTHTNGDYRIEYHPSDFLLGDILARRMPWLIVEVLEAPDGKAGLGTGGGQVISPPSTTVVPRDNSSVMSMTIVPSFFGHKC